MEQEVKNLCLVWLTVTVSLSYCYFFSGGVSSGKWRLVSVLPVVCIFAVIPFYTTTAFFTGVSAFLFAWLASFKLLLFAFDRGPISSQISLPVFIAMAALPFKLKPKTPSVKRKAKKLNLNLATEIMISAVLLSAVCAYRERVRRPTLLMAYACLLFLLIEFLVGVSGLVIGGIFGLEVEPASDEPYLSTSVREFWGRRWNLAVNEILREAVYRPVRSAAGGRPWGPVAAAMSAFVVSGIMHDVLLWYMTRAAPSWEMTAYFVVQGAFVVAEYGIMNGERKRRLPWFVGWPLTLGFVVGTSFWLFFPPMIRNGVDVRLLGELEFVVDRVRELGPVLWAYSTLGSN